MQLTESVMPTYQARAFVKKLIRDESNTASGSNLMNIMKIFR